MNRTLTKRFFLAAALALVTALPGTLSSHAEAPKIRWAYYVPWVADSAASFQQNIGALDYVSPYWYHMGGWGEISTADDRVESGKDALMQMAQRNGVKVVPLVQNIARYGDFSQVLQDPAIRAAAIQNVVQIAAPAGIAGVNIDFEVVEPETP